MRQSVKLVRALSLFLLLVVVGLYAGAIWLARGWRREAILRCGAGVLIVGLLLFVIRRVLQGVLLDALVGQRPARPAVSAAYLILTELLMAIAWTAVAVGTITVVLAFLAGPSRVARGVPHLRSARSRAAPLDRLERRRAGDPADPDRRTDH